MTFLVAALFLPLFPLNVVFNLLLDRLRPPLLRGLLLLLWPQLGVWLLEEAAQARRSAPATQEGAKDRRPPAVAGRPLEVWPD